MGAGPNIAAARKPVIVERNGLPVGFLAVNSILPQNYWAEDSKPGCAPMRGHTVYEQIEHDQPGTSARVHTFPHRADLTALVASIKALRPQVDHLVISHHAGIHFVKGDVPDYQRDAAYAAIDTGADIIPGSHAHVLKGMEFYKVKPIVYSLSNFAIDVAPRDPTRDRVSAMLVARYKDAPLPDDLILGTVRQLLLVGIIAPTTLIGSMAIHFSRHPEHLKILHDDPAKIPAAVEELLRLYSPYRGFARTPLEDIEVGGRLIRQDEPIALSFCAANRDPEVFEDPDTFRLDR